jgi:hypothetical protein
MCRGRNAFNVASTSLSLAMGSKPWILRVPAKPRQDALWIGLTGEDGNCGELGLRNANCCRASESSSQSNLFSGISGSNESPIRGVNGNISSSSERTSPASESNAGMECGDSCVRGPSCSILGVEGVHSVCPPGHAYAASLSRGGTSATRSSMVSRTIALCADELAVLAGRRGFECPRVCPSTLG